MEKSLYFFLPGYFKAQFRVWGLSRGFRGLGLSRLRVYDLKV